MRICRYFKVNECMKKIRVEAGISQKEMAAKLDLSVASLSNYENGYSEPPIEIIQNVCAQVGFPEKVFWRMVFDEKDAKQFHMVLPVDQLKNVDLIRSLIKEEHKPIMLTDDGVPDMVIMPASGNLGN